MSRTVPAAVSPLPAALDAAIATVGAGAAERDRGAIAPDTALAVLEAAGALALTVDTAAAGRPAHAAEWGIVRRVSAADGSVGRIVDGHLNGVERVGVLAEGALRRAELEAVRQGRRRIGVWGADPAPGEGPPARVRGDRLGGVKVFCSGAGLVDRALVVVRDEGGAARLAYVDVTRGTHVDRAWFRGSGMRTSESHRVEFRDAPVLALLGGPDAILREPWFSRDAMRTAACWAGIADAAAAAALAAIAARPDPGGPGAAAAGRIAVALGTIERWLSTAAAEAADPARDMRATSVAMRAAVAGACRAVVDEGTRAAGSRALATGDATLDRCARDLGLMLLQHRLEPMVERLGREWLEVVGA